MYPTKHKLMEANNFEAVHVTGCFMTLGLMVV